MAVRTIMKTPRWYARVLRSSIYAALVAVPSIGLEAQTTQGTGPSGSVLGELLNSDQVPMSAIPSQFGGSNQFQSPRSNSGQALAPVAQGAPGPQSQEASPANESVHRFLRSNEEVMAGTTSARMVLTPQAQSNSAQTSSANPVPRSLDQSQPAASTDPRSANRSAPPRSETGVDGSQVYQLQYRSMLQFEQVLEETYGSSLQKAFSADERFCRIALPSAVGQPMVMLVNRQTGQLSYEGAAGLRASWQQLMHQLDSNSVALSDGSVAQAKFVYPTHTDYETVRHTAHLMGLLQDEPLLPGDLQDDQEPQLSGQPQGKVTIIQDPNTGLLQIIVEEDADREMVENFIKALNEISRGKQKQPRAIALKNVQAATIETRVKDLYDAAYEPSFGTIEVASNPLNNSLVVIGLPDALTQIETIVKEFDTPPTDDATENFKTIKLKHMSAVDAKNRLDAYFAQSQQGIGAGDQRLPSIPVITITDFRSNTLVIKGSPQSIKEAELLISAIDIDKAEAEHEIKVIKVRNRLAEELAVIVQDAINGQQFGAGNGFKGVNQQQQQQFQQQQNQQVNPNASQLASKSLIMQPSEGEDEAVISGIMFDVRVTADRDSNSLIISAPPISMNLIEKLVHELDRVPDVEVQMKVFPIVNGDAVELLNTLTSLFAAGNQQQQQGGFGQQGLGQQGNLLNQLPLQTAGATPGSNLVNLRFSADPRTNTIIATGPIGELQVVEALLYRLDESSANKMATTIYRLSNAPALDIADTITQWIAGRDDVNSLDPTALGNFIQTNRRVIVVPEVVSNSLIVQAHPDYIEEVIEAIKALDRRPPMVKVQVLLAEVDLNRLEEFGMDLGLQDSILFDRGTTIGAGNAITGGIGFPFNTSATANVNAFGRENLAGQGLSNLGTGRLNSELGYGGLVLSAGNESISFLLRALENKRCVRVLSKPHIMTLENLQGRVQVGANVPRIAGTTINGLNVTQNVEFRDVGVILEVTPRVSPDGMIVLAVNASRSSVGPESTGITVGVGADGTPIRAPQILQTEAQTTLMARSGQTVVFAGLIQETKSHEERGVPILSNLPVVGPLFKFESDRASRTELLIIMTPTLVTDDEDVNLSNQQEMARMHWCLEDVAEIYGSTGYQVYDGTQSAVETVYPDGNPMGQVPPQAPNN